MLHGYRGETGPVAKIKGFDNAVQKLFAVVGQRVRAGLMTPTVCISYGGELDELRALPGYAQMKDVCAGHGVTVRNGDEPDRHGQRRQGRGHRGLCRWTASV